MAGIGEASAVIGVIEVGFSLARTLNTYIGDYKDSRESIISLASELDATIIQVKELNALVESNKSSTGVGEGSLKLAEKCVKDSDRLVKRLLELLTKARLPEDPQAIVNIKPEDLIVSRLTKAYWPLVKPQVDVVKSELHVMKTDILIARSCIQAQSGATAADRSAGSESIVALAKSRQLARRILRQAKAEEQRSKMVTQNPGSAARPLGDHGVDHPRRASADDQGNPHRYQPPARGPTWMSNDVQDTELIARDLRESVEKELLRRDAERKEKELTQEKQRQVAVETYQRDVKEKLARLKEHSETTQRQMREIFGSNLDEKQVQKFLAEQQSQQMHDDFGELLLQLGLATSLPRKLSKGGSQSSISEKTNRNSRRRWFFRHRSSRSSISTDPDRTATKSPYSASTPGNALSQRLLHVMVAYDMDKSYMITLDSLALQHNPCGDSCDLMTSLRTWQALPKAVMKEVDEWARGKSRSEWHLHAAMPIAEVTRTTRKFLQKAVLGEVMQQDKSCVLLVISFDDTNSSSKAERSSAADDNSSTSTRSRSPPGDEGAQGIQLSQTDIEEMRDWLKAKGLNASKIEELEALVKKRESPPSPDPQVDADGYKAHQLRRDDRPAEYPHGSPSSDIVIVREGPTSYRSRPRTKPLNYNIRSHNDTRDSNRPYFEFLSSRRRNSGEASDEDGFAHLQRKKKREVHIGEDEWPYRRAVKTNPEEIWRKSEEDQKKEELRRKAFTEYEEIEKRRELERELKILEETKRELEEERARGRAVQSLRDDAQRENYRPTRPNRPTTRVEHYGHNHYWRPPGTPPPEPRSGYDFPESTWQPYLSAPKRGAPAAEEPLLIREREIRRIHRTPSPSSPNRFTRYGRRSRSSSIEGADRERTDLLQDLRRSYTRSRPYGVSEKVRVLSPYRADTNEEPAQARFGLSKQASRRPQRSNDLQSERFDDLVHPQPRHAAFELAPRARSPEELIEDASEAEDAALDDEELKKKMLVKYTSVTAAAPASEPQPVDADAEPQNEASNEQPAEVPTASASPVPGVKRAYTATVEEEKEGEEETPDVQAGVAQRRTSSTAASSSSSSATSTIRSGPMEYEEVNRPSDANESHDQANDEEDQRSWRSLLRGAKKVTIPPPKRWW